MKKLLILFILTFTVFTLTGCNASKGTDELVTIINNLDEYSADFDFDDDKFSYEEVRGSGEIILVRDGTISVRYTDDNEVVTMQIEYERDGTNIIIYELFIIYINIDESLYMDINYDSYEDDSWDPIGYNAGNFNEFVELLEDMGTETFNVLYEELK